MEVAAPGTGLEKILGLCLSHEMAAPVCFGLQPCSAPPTSSAFVGLSPVFYSFLCILGSLTLVAAVSCAGLSPC